MKTKPVFLDELTTSSKAYKVKLKVIEKTRPQVSPSKKKVCYQNVVLEDEKGNRMRGTLFGDQIESYKEAFVYNSIYEISNAPIKPVDIKYKKEEDDLNYEMGFGRQTVIQPVGEEAVPELPQYVSLNNIPRAGGLNERFADNHFNTDKAIMNRDVLGVVPYVDEQARTITTRKGKETAVRDVTITDHSSKRPVIVTLWSDLAGTECASFSSWAGRFQVIGLTALKVYTVNGFSLSTTMSITILENPTGNRAQTLKEWVKSHQTVLVDCQAKLLDVRSSAKEKKIATIAELRKKKASNTLQEERLWLTVSLSDPDLDQIFAYLGGSKCGKRAEAVGPCEVCEQEGCIAEPRITLTCEITDGTDLLAVTAFTENAEKMLKSSAADIFHMKHTNDHKVFEKVKKRVETAQIMVKMGPHTNLIRNNVQQWVLKNVEEVTGANSEEIHQSETPCNAETTSSVTAQANVPASTTPKKRSN